MLRGPFGWGALQRQDPTYHRPSLVSQLAVSMSGIGLVLICLHLGCFFYSQMVGFGGPVCDPGGKAVGLGVLYFFEARPLALALLWS